MNMNEYLLFGLLRECGKYVALGSEEIESSLLDRRVDSHTSTQFRRMMCRIHGHLNIYLIQVFTRYSCLNFKFWGLLPQIWILCTRFHSRRYKCNVFQCEMLYTHTALYFVNKREKVYWIRFIKRRRKKRKNWALRASSGFPSKLFFF